MLALRMFNPASATTVVRNAAVRHFAIEAASKEIAKTQKTTLEHFTPLVHETSPRLIKHKPLKTRVQRQKAEQRQKLTPVFVESSLFKPAAPQSRTAHPKVHTNPIEEEPLSQKDIATHRQEFIDDFVVKATPSPQQSRELRAFMNSLRRDEHSSTYYRATLLGPYGKLNQEGLDTGILDPARSVQAKKATTKQYVEDKKRFNDSLNAALQNSTSIEERAAKLEAFLFEGVQKKDGQVLRGIERFNEEELKTIAMKFWDMGAYDHIVEMIENCPNKQFTSDPITLELYGRANMKSHYFSASTIRSIAKLLLDENPNQPEGLSLLGTLHGISKNVASETLAAIDRGEELDDETLMRYQQTFPNSPHDRRTVLELYNESLSSSLHYYEHAFEETHDCRYGCRTMHRLLEQGSERSVEAAELTRLAALKEGGLKSNNLAVVRAYLETLYILPDSDPQEIKLAQDMLLTLCDSESRLIDTIGSLHDLAVDVDGKEQFITALETQLSKMLRNPQEAFEVIQQKKEETKNTMDQWEKYTYNYKGINSNYIEGNFRFGAQLPAHNINRYDRQFFAEAVQVPLSSILGNARVSEQLAADFSSSLDQIHSYEDFNTIVDHIIRTRFHTDEWDLERLDSTGHVENFDRSVHALLDLGGAPTFETRKLIPDSRTNIAASFTLGIGDCRHHAQVKQIFYEVWQSARLNSKMDEMKAALETGDLQRAAQLKEEFQALNSHQLQTFDCEVYIPVKMQNGVPVWHEGHMVMNDTDQYVKAEEHTLNMEFQRDPQSGELSSIRTRDSFYTETYPWSRCEVDHKKKLDEGVQAGTVTLYNPSTGKLEERPIIIKPTAYAGKRDEYDKGNRENRFMGQPIKTKPFIQAWSERSLVDDWIKELRFSNFNDKKIYDKE